MITVLNDVVRAEIRSEMAWQELTQRELAGRIGWTPEYLSRRLSGPVEFTLTDVERISGALGTPLIQPVQHRRTVGHGARR